MEIKAAFFDMGGTIETFSYSNELRLKATPGLRRCLQTAGIDFPLDDQQLCDLVSSGWDRYRAWAIETCNELPASKVWRDYILADRHVDPVLLDRAAEDLMFYLETRFYKRELRPGVKPVLAAIKKMGLKIGLISNVVSLAQVPNSLEKYRIHQFFYPIVLSSEYGRRKPDPSIFHHAARLADVPTSACLYIGDRIARDVLGARRAGFAVAVQIINPFDHGEDDSGAEPDAVIHEMSELLGIIKKYYHPANPSFHQKENHPGEVHALIFDAGDILYHRPGGHQNLQAFLAKLGLAGKTIPEEKKKELKDQAFNGSITQTQYRQAILRLYGVSDPEQLAEGVAAIETDENNIRVFPKVKETLQTLKDNGYLLGIITDTANPIHVKLSWFEREGFAHVWDSFISSQELGFEKPDPRIYSASLNQLGLKADQAVFIGHAPEELEGAKKIGLRTIAFNSHEGIAADFIVKDFSGILSLPVITKKLK